MTDDKPLREPPRARAAFEEYCRLGPGRSLDKLLLALEKRARTENTPRITARRATLGRTARRILDGTVYVRIPHERRRTRGPQHA